MSDCNEELNNLYSSPNIITIKDDGMSRTEQIELMDIQSESSGGKTSRKETTRNT
jgi:hypothetical protein